MGEIRIKVRLENAGDMRLKDAGRLDVGKVRSVEIEAVADTGAVLTLLPQDLVENLGLVKIDKTVVTLANDQKIEMDLAEIFA